MKAVVPRILCAQMSPEKFCDLQTIRFRYAWEVCAGDSYDLFMREVIKVGFTSNHRVITTHENICVTNSGSGCASHVKLFSERNY